MNIKAAVFGILLIGLGGWAAYTVVTSSAPETSQSDTMEMSQKDSLQTAETMQHDATSSSAMEDHESMNMKADKGTYETYSPEKLALATDEKVVLFFHATWCPICRSLEQEIQANPAGIPAGVHLLKVDYDTAADLKKKYAVTYQHTFVQVDSQGKQISKWGDAFTLADVIKRIR